MGKKTAGFKILILVIVLAFASAFYAYFKKQSPKDYEWSLVNTGSSEYALYLRGPVLDSVTVAEVRFPQDMASSIQSVKSGGFYSDTLINPLNNNSTYVVIKNPEKEDLVDMSKPLLVISLSGGSDLSILPESQIYISKKGAYSPKVN